MGRAWYSSNNVPNHPKTVAHNLNVQRITLFSLPPTEEDVSGMGWSLYGLDHPVDEKYSLPPQQRNG
jgi:hypothetical protein